jgi:hypothetical protein
MRFFLLSLVTAFATLSHADNQSPVEPVTPSVKKLDGTRYQVGDVTFDQKTREIRFPTQVNMTEGLLEFLIVHQNGKVHESLLTTTVSPSHLNLAFTLLGYSPSKELYLLPDENGKLPTVYPDVPAEVKAAARVMIHVEWSDDGEIRRIPINEWIQHTITTTSMPAGPWVYGGSDFSQGIFAAETSGDVAAIYRSMAAILNYPGNDNDNDAVWTPFPKRVPPEGTNLTVIIAPYLTAECLPKP